MEGSGVRFSRSHLSSTFMMFWGQTQPTVWLISSCQGGAILVWTQCERIACRRGRSNQFINSSATSETQMALLTCPSSETRCVRNRADTDAHAETTQLWRRTIARHAAVSDPQIDPHTTTLHKNTVTHWYMCNQVTAALAALLWGLCGTLRWPQVCDGDPGPHRRTDYFLKPEPYLFTKDNITQFLNSQIKTACAASQLERHYCQTKVCLWGLFSRSISRWKHAWLSVSVACWTNWNDEWVLLLMLSLSWNNPGTGWETDLAFREWDAANSRYMMEEPRGEKSRSFHLTSLSFISYVFKLWCWWWYRYLVFLHLWYNVLNVPTVGQ